MNSIKLCWLVLASAVTILGCRKSSTEVELISLQEHTDALAPHVKLLQQQTLELMWQHAWLRHRLEKCIEKLEADRGLEPIPLENPAATMYEEMRWRKGKFDPNTATKYTRPPEPFYLPYESPNQPAFPTDKQHDIRTLIALLRLQSNSIKLYMSSADDWIGNFEKRLKRLEGCLKE